MKRAEFISHSLSLMKTKAFSLLLLFLGFGLFGHGQNPFQDIGVEVNPLTLSKGKYHEFHDGVSIVRIGNALFNVHSERIVGFVEADTLFDEATLQPEVTSRWLSVDPLAAEFPGWSPYAFGNNNPIIFVDPDGRKIVFANESSPETKALIERINYLRVSSEVFDALYGLLDADEKVISIGFNDELLNKLNADGATSPNGLVYYRSSAGDGKMDKGIVEELFHSYQFINYGITVENHRSKDAPRSTAEIEAEAKLFDHVVLNQAGTPPAIIPAWEEFLILDDDLIDLIEKAQDKTVTDKLLPIYYKHLEFTQSIHDQGADEDGAKVGTDAYTGKIRNLPPNAYNEVVKTANAK